MATAVRGTVGKIGKEMRFLCVRQSHFAIVVQWSRLPVIILTHFLIKLYLPDEPWPMDTATSAAVHGNWHEWVART